MKNSDPPTTMMITKSSMIRTVASSFFRSLCRRISRPVAGGMRSGRPSVAEQVARRLPLVRVLYLPAGQTWLQANLP